MTTDKNVRKAIMRIGTIVRNGWASKDNPIRYWIYIGGERVISFPNGQPHLSHHTGMLKDDKFQAVGFIDLKGELAKYKAMEE